MLASYCLIGWIFWRLLGWSASSFVASYHHKSGDSRFSCFAAIVYSGTKVYYYIFLHKKSARLVPLWLCCMFVLYGCCVIVTVLYGVWLCLCCMVVVWWDILYETLYCLPAWASQPLEPRPKVVGMLNLRLVNGFLPAGRPRCHLIIGMIVMIMLPRGVIMDLLNLQ